MYLFYFSDIMKLKLKYFLCGAFFLLACVFFKIRYFGLILHKKEISSTPYTKVFIDNATSRRTKFERQVTLVLRYNNDSPEQVAATVNSFLLKFPLMPVIIVSDNSLPAEIYQSFSNASKVLNIPLKFDLLNLIADRRVANYISTKYLLVVPKSVISFSLDEGLYLLKLLNRLKESFIAIPVERESIKCLKLKLNLMQWSIQYQTTKNTSEEHCDSLLGDHGILINSEKLKKIGEPFLLPFPEAFYIQTTALQLNVKLVQDVTLKLKFSKVRSDDFIWKNKIQTQIMNKLFKIKKIIRQDNTVEWYGCTRNTQRCFPSVINSVPEYLRQGRWTPPCCMKVLQETTRHVFKELKKWNVTFWLEGGSLLGAMRMKDIIPWDYDVDIGIYLKDIGKCPWLKKINSQKIEENRLPSIIDNDGFVWEKADPKEGDFFRVQASIHNRLHVDIFPFFSKNGIMTKNTWFPTHPQDKEFPEHYLKPLTTIEFAGVKAPAPNNVKEFLEFKFGKGCVENPQYPNPKMFPFPEHAKHLVVNDVYNYDVPIIT